MKCRKCQGELKTIRGRLIHKDTGFYACTIGGWAEPERKKEDD
jgi:hypothetical protein